MSWEQENTLNFGFVRCIISIVQRSEKGDKNEFERHTKSHGRVANEKCAEGGNTVGYAVASQIINVNGGFVI